jgi:hypothetical protein
MFIAHVVAAFVNVVSAGLGERRRHSSVTALFVALLAGIPPARREPSESFCQPPGRAAESRPLTDPRTSVTPFLCVEGSFRFLRLPLFRFLRLPSLPRQLTS